MFLKQIVELLRVNDFLILDKVVWTLNNLCAKNPQNQAEVQAVQGIPLLVGCVVRLTVAARVKSHSRRTVETSSCC